MNTEKRRNAKTKCRVCTQQPEQKVVGNNDAPREAIQPILAVMLSMGKGPL